MKEFIKGWDKKLKWFQNIFWYKTWIFRVTFNMADIERV